MGGDAVEVGSLSRVGAVAPSLRSVSGQRCREHVARLSQIHRIVGAPAYTEALEYARAALLAAGVTDVEVERFVTDGSRAYGDWIAPVAWTPRRAELWIERPERIKLCDFGETPISLHVGSQSTPDGGLADDLVDVGPGAHDADYGGRDVRGRIVLTSGNVRDVYDEAVRRRGARGLITDTMPWQAASIARTPAALPDAVSYNKLPVRGEDVGSGVFSFGLSARQGGQVRALLAAGPVRVRASVDAEAGPGRLEVLSARIPGVEQPDEEIVLVAHLCHPSPGANDNATGPALLLELARSLGAAGRDGRSQLRRTVRLLLVPELYGTVAWLLEGAAPRGAIKAAINLDMVGADGAKTRGKLWLDRTPWSRPSFLDDLVASALECVAAGVTGGWPYGVREHAGGSDHIAFLAPEVAAPAVMLGHFPDLYYHTSEDTVDKTSELEFERVGAVVAAVLSTLDRLTARTAIPLVRLVRERAVARVRNYAPGNRADVRIALSKEHAALDSIREFLVGRGGAALHAELDAAKAAVERACPVSLEAPTVHEGPVLRKVVRGPLSSHLMGLTLFQQRLGARARAYRERSLEDLGFVLWMSEAFNLVDGRRTTGEIDAILAAEFGDAASAHRLEELVGDLTAAEMVAPAGT